MIEIEEIGINAGRYIVKNNGRSKCLKKAEKVVNFERNKEYGQPEDSFGDIAKFWSTYLKIEITPIQVAGMMALLKIARSIAASNKPDTWIDLAGYAACAYELSQEEVDVPF